MWQISKRNSSWLKIAPYHHMTLKSFEGRGLSKSNECLQKGMTTAKQLASFQLHPEVMRTAEESDAGSDLSHIVRARKFDLLNYR
jgi:GMP synthase-like glutamine amidotransferase